jgi:hypothetical protein
MTTRKTLHHWLRSTVGTIRTEQHNRFYSAYRIIGISGDVIWIAINKKARLSDYTILRDRQEIGVNAGIYAAACKSTHPIRLAVCWQGRVYAHHSLDLRSATPPEIRVVYGQAECDEQGVAWWPAEDFTDVTDGLVVSLDPAPRATPTDQPSILSIFSETP